MDNFKDLKRQLLSKPYTWGQLVTIHEISEYLIVEYKKKVYSDPIGGIYEKESSYHVYINGKDTGHTYESLDHALVGAIATKYDGINSRAAWYFMNSLTEGGQLTVDKRYLVKE